MRILKNLLDVIVFGNIYVAIGAVCLIQSSIIQLGFIANHLFFYSLLSFFATLFVYNFQRVFYVPKKNNSLHSVRREWIFKNQHTVKSLTIIGLIGVCFCFFFNDFKIVFYLSPLLVLSLAYFLPFIKLRKSAWFKLVTLTVVWTMVTAVVPILLCSTEPFTKNNLLHIFVRSFFMIGICIPFDIRDLAIDKVEDVSTLPHLFGENKTRWIAVFFMIIYLLLIIVEYYEEILNLKLFVGLLVSALISTVLVACSNSKRSEYFFVAGIDGTMILQGILLIAVNYI